MDNIETIQDFFKICAPENTKKCNPSLAPPVPRGDGALCDAPALPVSGAHLDTGNKALSQPGDAIAAGAEACRSPRERQ